VGRKIIHVTFSNNNDCAKLLTVSPLNSCIWKWFWHHWIPGSVCHVTFEGWKPSWISPYYQIKHSLARRGTTRHRSGPQCTVMHRTIFHDSFETNYFMICRAIYTKFSPNGTFLIVDYRSDPLFPIGKGTLPWQPIFGHSWQKPFIRPVTSRNELEYRNAAVGALTLAMIWLHRVKIRWTWVSQPRRSGERVWISRPCSCSWI